CAAIAVTSELSEDDILLVTVRQPGSELTPALLVDHCRTHLPRYMVPRYVDIRDEPLPWTPTEKIAKTELRAAGLTPSTWDAHVTAAVWGLPRPVAHGCTCGRDVPGEVRRTTHLRVDRQPHQAAVGGGDPRRHSRHRRPARGGGHSYGASRGRPDR